LRVTNETRKYTRCLPLIFFLMFSVFTNLVYAHELEMSTNKSSYGLGATVKVYGTLTLGGNPITDGLVAVQVEDSMGELKLIRVVPTGTPPPPWKVRIVEFLSCDSQGNPKSEFTRGTLAYFKITVESFAVIKRQVKIFWNLFDWVGVSIGAICVLEDSLEPGERYSLGPISMPIPNDAFAGPAICTASILTEWPEDDGFPYCPEGLTEFAIIGGGSQPTVSSSEWASTGSGGSFNVSFKLPSIAKLGNYSIYARARYNAWTSISFDYFWLLTDIDRDGEVKIQDLYIIAQAYGSKLGDQSWNPKADFNGDDQVDIADFYKVARDFGKTRT
jgi:hypothetical protein